MESAGKTQNHLDAASRASLAEGSMARKVGRGGVYLTFTKLYFILMSYVIYFGLPFIGKRIGREGLFGDYKAVNAYLSVIGTVLVTGTIQAVARFVGRSPGHARVIRRRAVEVQLVFGLLTAALFFLLAPWFAKDPRLVDALRVAAGIPLVYAVYSVFMGTLNGQGRYGEQALMDACFTTLKVLSVLLGAWILGSVSGAFGGFLLAALVVLGLSGMVVRRGQGHLPARDPSAPSQGALFRFQLQTVGFMLLVQWMVQMDIWYAQWFSPHPQASLSAVRNLWGATQLFSQISYSLVVAVTFVLFPLVSKANLRDRPGETRGYVREALRYALLIVVGVAVILGSTPESSIGLLLDLKTLRGAAPGLLQMEGLRYLSLGYIFFALFFILCSVLNAGGLPRMSILLAGGTAALQLGLSWFLVPRLDLVGEGLAGLLAMALGCLLALLVLSRLLGSILPWPTLLRVLLSGGGVYALAQVWHPEGRFQTAGRFVVEGLLFLLLMVLMKEWKAADRRRFAQVLGRGGKKQ